MLRKFKIVSLLLVLTMVSVLLCSCGNKDVWDTVRRFDRVVLTLPDGTVVAGQVQTWTDYSDGDQLQVKIDGVTYLVHSTNCVLIAE